VYVISYNAKPVTPALAEELSWALSFIGVPDGSGGGGDGGGSDGGAMVGATSSSSAWEVVPWRKPGPHGEGPMYLDVDTSRSRYLDTPTYVSVLARPP